MRNARAVIAGVLTILVTGLVAGCGSSSTTPTPPSSNGTSQVKFTATLLPANEVAPSIPSTDPEAGGSGTSTITLNVTRDTAGNIIAASADFQVSLSGFPASTPVTAAHIHPGAAGTNGSPLVNLSLGSGEIVLTNGSGNFSKTGIGVGVTDATAMLNTPANYYFNVHSTLHSGGFARGQLVKQ